MNRLRHWIANLFDWMGKKMQTDRSASDLEHWWGSATPGRALSNGWLLAFLIWAHLSDVLFQNRWAAFTSGLGLLTTVLVWTQRGRFLSTRWCICLWGAIEGLEIFVCHGVFNWYPIRVEFGQCSAFTSLPLWGVGLGAAALLTGMYRRRNGR